MVRRFTFALAMLLGTGLCIRAPAEIRGVAGTDDVVGKLTRQVAALETRLNQLEKAQAAINRRLDKVDVSDDGSGDDAKKSAGKSKGDAPPDKGPGNGAGNSSGGSGKNGAELNDVPGKSPAGSTPANGGAGSGRTSNRVVAPFDVVDKSGKVIFRVQDPAAGGGEGGGDRGIYVFEETGKTVAQLVASHGGGKLKVQKPASDTYVTTAANNDGIGSVVRQDGKQRTFTGVGSNNGGVMAVFGADGGHPAAGLQLSQGGGGLVAVFKNDTPISFLTESTTHPGGGNVTTTDSGGRGVFSAGYDGDSGSACVARKGALHCLGVGLPLGGGN